MAIVKRKQNLPVKPLDLQKWILVGKAKLAAQIKAIRGIKELKEGQAAVAAALSDTQDLAEELLYAEAQLGSIIPPMNLTKGGRGKTGSSGGTSLQQVGITRKQSHFAQALSRNEDSIARVVAKAREQGEVPVRQHVLKDIQANKPKPPTPDLPKGKFNVIYADPPWRYDFCIDDADRIEKHYSTMETEDIANIKIPAETNTVLYLWATAPKLLQAAYVMERWGFEYKTNLTWDKEWIGMGYWFRGLHEHLLVGTRGNIPPPPKELRVDSILHEKRTAHSKKPEIIYEWIEKWYPKQKWIELFARKKRTNWTMWGNEI